MAIGVTLTPNAAKRTAIAVRRVLGPKPPDLMPVESVERAGYDFLQYWVEITGGSATAGYTFKRIKHAADGTHADFDPAYTTGKAFELNSLGVAVGTVVRLTYMGRTAGETPEPFFVFSSPSPVIPVRPTAAASGGGKYTGYTVVAPTSAVSASGNVAASDMGTNGVACLIVNAAEEGQSTHGLTAGTPVQKTFIGYYLGMSSDSTPKPVYLINGFEIGCAS